MGVHGGRGLVAKVLSTFVAVLAIDRSSVCLRREELRVAFESLRKLQS